MGEEHKDHDVYELALRQMVAALPEADRPAAMARVLDEIEALHREEGAPPPPWIARVRERLGLGPSDERDDRPP